MRLPKEEFPDYINLNLRMLRAMGLSIKLGNVDTPKSKASKILEVLPTAFTILVGVAYGIFQILWIIDLWSQDKYSALQILNGGLSNIGCMCRGFQMAYGKKNLVDLFNKLSVMWKTYCPTCEIKGQIFQRAHDVLKFCKLYFFTMMGLVICFGLPPLTHLLFESLKTSTANDSFDYSLRVFPMKYPFKVDSMSVHLPLLILEEYTLINSGIYWLCCDTLFAQLTAHTALQFQILKHDIECNEQEVEKDERQAVANIVEYIQRYQSLIELCQCLQRIFNSVLFILILLTSVSICINIIELQETIVGQQYGKAVYHCFYLFNIFFQLFVFCIYAEMLHGEVSSVSDAIYRSNWMNNHRLKKYYTIFLTRSQRSFHYSAYGFFSLGHEQITFIVNKAISFYVLLRTI